MFCILSARSGRPGRFGLFRAVLVCFGPFRPFRIVSVVVFGGRIGPAVLARVERLRPSWLVSDRFGSFRVALAVLDRFDPLGSFWPVRAVLHTFV